MGFMDQAEALNHLKIACVNGNKSDPQLIADWQTARGNLGAAFPNAGRPNIQAIPAAHQPYVQQLIQLLTPNPIFASILGQGATFQLVEIDALLAFQFVVDTDRSNAHCQNLSPPPTMDELLNLCVPQNWAAEAYFWDIQGQSAVFTSRSLNLQILSSGANTATGFAGIQFGFLPPMVYVTRYNGRCYLSNGFHRTFGARRAGATHVPCLFHDVSDYHIGGIRDDGGTFRLSLLESANPPSVAHFTQGRAHDISLRGSRRVLHVSWANHVVFDE
ncbi:MAG: hypothetical protein WA624_19535 [Methylocella sp.]